MSTRTAVQRLPRPEGSIAYTVDGEGPLVVAVPGMGDVRSTYRELVPPLVAAGYRVAVMDLRGHGDSETTFRTHGDVATGTDVLALIGHLGGPAVVVGSSMGAGAAAWAAAEDPGAVAGLVLLGAFLRDGSGGRVTSALLHLTLGAMLRRPWGPAVWGSYYSMITKGRRATWHREHVAEVRDALRRPGNLRSFRELATSLTHAPVEARLGEVRVPSVVVGGAKDPDFPDPAAEVAWIGATIGAREVLVPDVGHYPQHQAPEIVAAEALGLLAAALPVRPADDADQVSDEQAAGQTLGPRA